jgi:PAS domain S-box-containing protein
VSDSNERRVLVIDDERRYAEAHARMLQDEYAVETAYGGQAGLDALTDDLDVIVLDRNMPTLPGDEVATEVRERNLDCRIVMITAVEPDLDIVDMGIDDYLTKPVSEDELKECLADALEWAEYDDTLRDYFALSNKREVLLAEGSDLEETEQFSEIEKRLMEAAERGLQKSEEVLRTLINSSPAAIVALDEAGKIDIWNPSAEEMFGWSHEDVTGKDPPIFTPEAQEQMEDVRTKLFRDTTVTDFHIECLDAAGSRLDVSLSASPLYDSDGEMYGTMFVMTDITERKQREQRLSVMSRVLRHNMRNELNVVMGRAEVVKKHLPPDEKEHIDEAIETLRDLLRLSRKAQSVQEVLGEDTGDIGPRDVSLVFDQLLTRAEENYPDARVRTNVTVGQPSVIAGEGLRTALWQLVENAIEHNEGDATVELVLVREATDDAELMAIRVADDGPGIPPQEIEVLDRDEEDALTHGSGIGLWATQWIIDRSGGELQFSDSHLDGAEVSILLPAADADGNGEEGTAQTD